MGGAPRLPKGGWGGRHAKLTPFTCYRLQTATHVLDGLRLTGVEVEENIRETLGEDTCDARRWGGEQGPLLFPPPAGSNPCPLEP